MNKIKKKIKKNVISRLQMHRFPVNRNEKKKKK